MISDIRIVHANNRLDVDHAVFLINRHDLRSAKTPIHQRQRYFVLKFRAKTRIRTFAGSHASHTFDQSPVPDLLSTLRREPGLFARPGLRRTSATAVTGANIPLAVRVSSAPFLGIVQNLLADYPTV